MSPLYIFMDFLSRNIVFTVFAVAVLVALVGVSVALIVMKVRTRRLYRLKKTKK